MTKSEIAGLLKYDSWAVAHTLTAVEKLDVGYFEQDMMSSFKSIQGTVTHIYGVQRMWFARWTGKGENALPASLLSQSELRDRWFMLQAEWMEFIARLTDEQLLAPFRYNDIRGTPFVQPLWQQIQHVVNHSSYYRGQLTVMLRQCGVVPPRTDLISYYRQH